MQEPPFSINVKILGLVAKIQAIIGELQVYAVPHSTTKVAIKLRKENKIRTIRSSLAIEGNNLTEDQITAILENKRVIGPPNQILEVKNALSVYDSISQYNPLKEKDFLVAHQELLKNLIKQSGKYRSTQVGVFKGTKVSHMAPPAKQVPLLMQELFKFLNKDRETPWLIKACVFHYELEFIHPFEDGNGRMGRFWQQLLLIKQSPIFEHLSTETLIYKRQKDYYKVMEKCDRAGDSTQFIVYSLEIILSCLEDFRQKFRPTKAKVSDRIQLALEYFGTKTFSRKEYLAINKGISTATASRDLANGVKNNLISKNGDKTKAVYRKNYT